ncbi:MAG: twin-arginine translocase TatA/TatE family subunit [Anaerolineae bacterium]|nr:MAG: twin-arginine translocase TatA/TatE family subunit [Anaerolineae bacterium]
MIRLGPAELVIVLVIVVLLFGPGRISNVLGELGKGLRSFKDALSGEKPDEAPQTEQGKRVE